MDFTNKIVVFVGGFGGIGFETCKQIIKKDIAFLVILDAIENPIAIQTLKSMNTKCEVSYFKFDITSKGSIQGAISKTIEKTKYIDILINGAGILQESDMERTININLIGLINTTYEALPYMDKCKFGRGGLILNISSITGLEPFSAIVAYSTSKCGVIGFSRCMSDSYYYETTGVAVTASCPGLTETALKNSISSNCTFDYGKVLGEEIKNIRTQSTTACAEHLIRIIEANKNGSIWISDCGKLVEVELKVYWTPVTQ